MHWMSAEMRAMMTRGQMPKMAASTAPTTHVPTEKARLALHRHTGDKNETAHPFQYGHGAPQALSPAACATHSMMKAFMRTSTLMMI